LLLCGLGSDKFNPMTNMPQKIQVSEDSRDSGLILRLRINAASAAEAVAASAAAPAEARGVGLGWRSEADSSAYSSTHCEQLSNSHRQDGSTETHACPGSSSLRPHDSTGAVRNGGGSNAHVSVDTISTFSQYDGE
jgi:hypothetical protein